VTEMCDEYGFLAVYGNQLRVLTGFVSASVEINIGTCRNADTDPLQGYSPL
jgi:hypothetical protein